MNKVPLGYWGQDPERAQLREVDSRTLRSLGVTVTGYAGDRCGQDPISGADIARCQKDAAQVWASTQWASRGNAFPVKDSKFMLHQADTYAGQSGGPMYLPVDNKLCLAGIHLGEVNAKFNKGLRVTKQLLNQICAWMNAEAGEPIAAVEEGGLVFIKPDGKGLNLPTSDWIWKKFRKPSQGPSRPSP